MACRHGRTRSGSKWFDDTSRKRTMLVDHRGHRLSVIDARAFVASTRSTLKCSAPVESGPTMCSCTATLPQVCRQSERSPFHLSYSCAHAVMRCMYVPLTVTRRLCSGYVQTPMSTCKCEHWGSRRTDVFLSIARARPSLITTVANVRAGRCNRRKILLYEVTSSSDKTPGIDALRAREHVVW